MVAVGVDCGAKNVRIVVLGDGRVAATVTALTGLDQGEAVERSISAALAKAGLTRSDVSRLVATGVGRKAVSHADDQVTEVTADARGAVHAVPAARTVVDVGAEEARAIRCDARGRVLDFAINEKCAAGTGAFVEAMSRVLEVPLDDLGALALQSSRSVPMNAQCAVFAESEVVSLLHARVSRADIARAIHEAITGRVSTMVRRVGIERQVVLVGGMARNAGFVDALQRALGIELAPMETPELAGALGAALLAAGL